MADLSNARSAASFTPSSVLRAWPPAARHVLRGAPEMMEIASQALGLRLSLPACRAATDGTRSALWLGPDERLLLGEASSAADTERRLQQALRDQSHSLVDISHRQTAFELTGPRADAVLNSGCPLDLDASAFPVGMCTRTVLGKAQIVLWRIGDDSFHLEVWRSFAAYVSGVIAEAAREYTVG